MTKDDLIVDIANFPVEAEVEVYKEVIGEDGICELFPVKFVRKNPVTGNIQLVIIVNGEKEWDH
jgi:hypothetical protein